MKYLSLLLHCYQPPWQDKDVLEKVIDQCYRPLFDLILRRPDISLNINVNYSLFELFQKNGHQELIRSIGRSVSLGRVELTGSGAYHPILPLLSESECQRQILLNEAGIAKTLGKYLKNGFFPPEMAFHPNLAKTVKEAGYRWLIADDLPFINQYGFAPFDFVPLTKGLPILMRSRLWSNRLAFREFTSGQQFINCLSPDLDHWFKKKDGYLIIALDAETFGHHHQNYLQFFEEIYEELHYQVNFRNIFISEILTHFPTQAIEVPFGSWSTSTDDLKRGIAFPLWWHPDNRSHQLLWELIDTLLMNLDKNDFSTRELMDRALNSCQFWWLSSAHWNPVVAFKTMPMYVQIIDQLHFSKSVFKKIRKILERLGAETGYKLKI